MVSKLLFLLYEAGLRLVEVFHGSTGEQGHPGKFVQGINFGGPALTIEGDRWLSLGETLTRGLTMADPQTARSYVKPNPSTSYSITKMLNTVAFKAKALTLQQSLPDGSYDLYLWLMENYRSDWHSLQVAAGDQVIAPAIGQLKLGDWGRYGPYRVRVEGGSLTLTLTSNTPADAHLMGLSIFAVDPSI
ncbi:MAG: hypothetical protein KGQ93_04655 [Cyanobacteria bacterium REEB459]|nr:hypothetical protein [Cyanobacteria bacterium REEB459]